MSIRIKGFEFHLQLPDFALITADDWMARRSHGVDHRMSMILDILQRFPFQPEFPAYPEAMIKDYRLEQRRKDRDASRMLITDFALQKLAYEHAVAKDINRRIKQRRLQGRDADERYHEHQVADQIWMHKHMYHKVREAMMIHEAGTAKARRLAILFLKFMHTLSLNHRLAEAAETKHLIKAGFERHARFLEWRLDNLFAMSENHGISKVKHKGQLLEHVFGEVEWALRRAVTTHHKEWRKDNLFAMLPNGGIARVHHFGAGMPLEHAAALAYWPLVHKRTDGFQYWHDTNNRIETPNHNLVHVHLRGHIPENAYAHINQPHLDERVKKFLDWHLTHLMYPLPNGSYVPTTVHNHGHSVEKVTSDIGWEHKREVTKEHWHWRKDVLYAKTANGNILKVKSRGEHLETISAAVDKPKREAVTKGYTDWHLGHLFLLTPNGVFAPRKGIGHSIEGESAKAMDKPKHQIIEGYKRWHEGHDQKETSNHLFAPQRGSGRRIEKVAGEITKYNKQKVTEGYLRWRLANLFVPTGNGGWRRLDGTGKDPVAIRAEIAEPVENGGDAPLPSRGGHALASAKLLIAEKRRFEQRKSVREFQRLLAAHEQTVSKMQDHIVRLGSEGTATNADALPAKAASKTGKL